MHARNRHLRKIVVDFSGSCQWIFRGMFQWSFALSATFSRGLSLLQWIQELSAASSDGLAPEPWRRNLSPRGTGGRVRRRVNNNDNDNDSDNNDNDNHDNYDNDNQGRRARPPGAGPCSPPPRAGGRSAEASPAPEPGSRRGCRHREGGRFCCLCFSRRRLRERIWHDRESVPQISAAWSPMHLQQKMNACGRRHGSSSYQGLG